MRWIMPQKKKKKEEPEGEVWLMGWECPRCHKIHSPYVQECDCAPKTYTVTFDSNSSVTKIFNENA